MSSSTPDVTTPVDVLNITVTDSAETVRADAEFQDTPTAEAEIFYNSAKAACSVKFPRAEVQDTPTADAEKFLDSAWGTTSNADPTPTPRNP